MTTIRIILFILSAEFIYGQVDSTCRLDPSGKKNGYCKIFLDDKAMPSDSLNAFFWGYEFYDAGKTPFKRFIKIENSHRYKITFEGERGEKGRPIPISGTMRWFEVKNGQELIYLEEKFENGYAQLFKEFNSEGKPSVTFNYTLLYKNTPGTLWVEHAEGDMSITFQKLGKGWVRKLGKKWKYLKIKDTVSGGT